MKRIEMARWKQSSENPHMVEYVGPRTAEEVFQELKHRLDSMGYLPEEYFLLNSEWENGREVPKEADIFCTTDYGGSEGVYLDVYLTWEENNRHKKERFITGKTLGESGSDLDRMFLISSAITKAFHGDRTPHARYMKIGGAEDEPGGEVFHLSQQEQKTIIEALVEQRERQENAMSQTEQLLRRMTGSITGYINEVGQRPLRMSDYDKAVLAIRDGELPAFRELYPKVLKDHADDLLIEAAGRPGAVGRKITAMLLVDVKQFSEPTYCTTCQKAIGIDDLERVSLLLEQAERHVPELSPSFHGEMASYAYLDHRFIAREIVKQCGGEQIAAAPPRLLEQFAMDKDWRTLSTLVEKGISGGSNAARTLHMLTCQKSDCWIAEGLLQKRMWVDISDYSALHACIQNDAVEIGEMLLDGGMDFDGYRKWAEARHCCGHEETVQALADHWTAIKETEAQKQDVPEAGGMTLG